VALDDLEQLILTFAEKMHFTEPTRKELNEERSILSGSVILVSKNIRYICRVLQAGGVKPQ